MGAFEEGLNEALESKRNVSTSLRQPVREIYEGGGADALPVVATFAASA